VNVIQFTGHRHAVAHFAGRRGVIDFFGDAPFAATNRWLQTRWVRIAAQNYAKLPRLRRNHSIVIQCVVPHFTYRIF